MTGTTATLFSPSERDRILQAATELCAEQGFAQTTVEQVAGRAGVSVESFGASFTDLEDCLLTAVNGLVGEVVGEVAAAYSADRSEWDSGLHAIKAILELMATRPAYAYLGYVYSRQLAPPRINESYRSATHMLSAMIERLWEYSDCDAQPVQGARAALGAAEALVRREIVAGRTAQLPRLMPDFIYGATVPFLGQEEGLRMARRSRELLRDTPWAIRNV